MALLKYKGKRIRASDRYLVYRFCAGYAPVPVRGCITATEHGTAHAYRLGAFQITG